jgi:cytochrome oxidase assembly protein ShyY1
VYRFLLTRQWVILTLISLLLIPTMIRLGFWQKHRYEERSARNALVSQALNAKPVPAEQVTTPGHAVTRKERYHTVTATGTFDTADEVVVRGRASPPPPSTPRRGGGAPPPPTPTTRSATTS